MQAQKREETLQVQSYSGYGWLKSAAVVAFCDVLIIFGAYFFALMARFDFSLQEVDTRFFEAYVKIMPFWCAVTIIAMAISNCYRSIWRFAGVREVERIVRAYIILAFVYFGHFLIVGPEYHLPRSCYLIGYIVAFTFHIAIRLGYRFVCNRSNFREQKNTDYKEHIMVIGAGQAGRQIVQDIIRSDYVKAKVECVIDDAPAKIGKELEGIPIVGNRYDIPDAVEKFSITRIIYAIPSSDGTSKKEALSIAKETGCKIQVLPGTYQLVNGEVSISQLRNVEIEDLLGRDPIKVNSEGVFKYITGKTILVTGGGGSIGSELCRQIAAHHPKKLIIFDVYENNAYDIQLELKKKYPEINLDTIIGSVRDSRKIFQVFEDNRPEVVYHAAAHKHVPLMEDSPCEAIKNNVIGTYKTAFAAMTHGCERFVLISTDKAVNPTNIMGASKRLCEMVIQAFDEKIKQGKAAEIPQLFTHLMKDEDINQEVQKALKNTKTEFVAVRFGNVLGSNGSVIPLFKKQLEAGGPITVTHPDIIRYFMTIPEAVGLVLEAGTKADGGEIFVLDMGDPIKIADLAKNMIRCSGLVPDVDIKIEYTGLRPGEKLYEEKLMAEEGLKKTDNDLIHIGCPIPFEVETFLQQLYDLMEAAYKNRGDIRELVQEVVSTYHPA